jgi:hypothetical protein
MLFRATGLTLSRTLDVELPLMSLSHRLSLYGSHHWHSLWEVASLLVSRNPFYQLNIFNNEYPSPALAFRNFWIRRITFARHLQNSNSALTTSRYFRLMCMALVQMFLAIGVTAFNMWFTMRQGLRPWTGWADVHVDFSRIALFPTLVIPAQALTYTFVLWWTIPISSVLFFGFFSFGQDAMKEYRACVIWVRQNVFRIPESIATFSSMSSLPS